jgi:hypothetical protein
MDKPKIKPIFTRYKILVWSMRRRISEDIEAMLYKHCDVKPVERTDFYIIPVENSFLESHTTNLIGKYKIQPKI